LSAAAPDARPRPWLIPACIAALAVLAVTLRWRCFHAYVDEGDPCEYVWAIRQAYLPHSPYVLFLWIGRAMAACGAPADIGLSALSLASGLSAVALLGLVVRRQTAETAAGWLASLGFAVFPICVWFSGIQEVYALQTALALAAVCAALSGGGPASGAAAGLLFGAAFSAHDGTILLAPAMAVAVWDGTGAGATLRARLARLARLGAALLGASLMPVLAYGWLAWIFAHRDAGPWIGPWLRYLRGITPAPELGGLGAASALARIQALVAGSLGAIAGSVAIPLALLVIAIVILLAVRGRRTLLFWTIYAAPCLAYELALGRNVDPGIYMVYLAPALAAILAAAATVLPARARGPAVAVLVAGALLGPCVRSAALAEKVVSRDAFLRSEWMQTCDWLRRHAPPGSVLVQPPGLEHVNFMPCHTGLRPIIVQEGLFRIFVGGPGTPLNLDAFPLLQPAHLDRLLDRGVPVLSLVPDPFRSTAGDGERTATRYRWREETIAPDAGAEPPRALYVLERNVGR
jgi:hypothetical protein